MATNPTPRPPMVVRPQNATSSIDAAGAKGAAKHRAKMALQSRQLKGEGAMTGGFATSPGAPVTKNSNGKFLAKGKN